MNDERTCYDGEPCPFCNGSKTYREERLLYEDQQYHCEDCDVTFDNTDIWYEKVYKPSLRSDE